MSVHMKRFSNPWADVPTQAQLRTARKAFPTTMVQALQATLIYSSTNF